ncbi:MAG: hypothetical protein F6K54_20760 [Okeania sp. SIO3B5]|uniref:hypothetical protein n=1 Tax=Okeania sp. SIO3B5 TaxID=2607811 RepID=UPI0014016C85|nr:hypothetical protein [Okeania sp. SIO3B5]NEO55286.1 hypothetical protein [Okeania sp. SIO3B5]
MIADVTNYLRSLGYTDSEVVFFRAIKSKHKAKNLSYQKSNNDFVALENLCDALKKLNEQGYGIYAVVNGGGNTDCEVEQCRAIFYEHDNLPKDEQQQLWEKLNLPEPTFQVDTGGRSIHSYWVFDNPLPVEDWKILQSDLLDYSDVDRSISNPARLMRVPGFTHQKSGTRAKIISKSGKLYSYDCLRKIIPMRTQSSDRSPAGILFPIVLYTYYRNPLALWLYCRFYDRQGSGRAVIDLAECAQELQISVSTLRKWLCWEPRLWRSWKTRKGIATIYYVSAHNKAAKIGKKFDGGVAEIEDISDIANHRLPMLATEIELQEIQKKSRYAAHEQAVERAEIKYLLDRTKTKDRKKLDRLVPKTLDPNDLVNLPAKNLARVLWKAGVNLGVSEGFLAYGASQERVAASRWLSVRQVQRHLSNEYRSSESPVRNFRNIYPIFGVQINQRLNRHRGECLDRAERRELGFDWDSFELMALGIAWKNKEGRWFERKCKIYEQTVVLRKARFRRSRVRIDK